MHGKQRTNLLDDKEFLTELKAQKHAAYARLMAEFQEKVFNTCLSFVPNQEDAEDDVPTNVQPPRFQFPLRNHRMRPKSLSLTTGFR